jgi:hypothetical protein
MQTENEHVEIVNLFVVFLMYLNFGVVLGMAKLQNCFVLFLFWGVGVCKLCFVFVVLLVFFFKFWLLWFCNVHFVGVCCVFLYRYFLN